MAVTSLAPEAEEPDEVDDEKTVAMILKPGDDDDKGSKVKKKRFKSRIEQNYDDENSMQDEAELEAIRLEE